MSKSNKELRLERIQEVSEKSGLPVDVAEKMMKDAKKRLGIKYGAYLKNEFWKIPVEEQEDAYNAILKQKEKKAKAKAAREEKIKALMEQSGWDYETSKNALTDARKRIGIKYGAYIEKEFWKIPVEEQEDAYKAILEKAEKQKKQKALREERIKSLMEQSGWDYETSKKALADARKRIGIKYGAYIEKEFWKIPAEEQEDAYKNILKENAEKKRAERIRPREEKQIQNVMNKTGWDYEYTAQKLASAREKFGIAFRDYISFRLWRVDEERLERVYRNNLKKRNARNNWYEDMIEESELTKKELQSLYAKAKAEYGLTLFQFKDNKFWGVPEESKASVVEKIKSSRDVVRAKKEIEKKAAEKRKSFVLAEMASADNESADNSQAYPKTLRIACALLDNPLPEDLDISKQPSHYIKEMDSSLESIRAVVGEAFIPDSEEMRSEYNDFARRYRNYGPVEHTDTDLAVFFVDWIFFARDFGFNHSDYFEYKFFIKDIEERNTFLSQGYRGYVREVCNTNIGLFKSKPRFNAFFADLIRRDWLKVTPDNFDEFKEFVSKHSSFFSKPIKGGGGVGAGILSTDDKSVEELFEYCSANECIVEELVIQHERMAAFNPGTVNTCRLYTLIKADGEVIVTGAAAKFGRPGIFADNLLQGGVGVEVDAETGVILCDAVDVNCNKYERHPDSGIKFVGYQIPNWDKVVDIAKRGALHVKQFNRHVGWDLAVRADGEIEIIEGNSWPDLSLLQVADCIGKLHFYDKYIRELAARINMPEFEMIPECKLDVRNAEQAKKVKELLKSIVSE